MRYAYITINDLSEVDYDDLYARSKDVLDMNWSPISTFTDEEKKNRITDMINSGAANEWPGLNPHHPSWSFLMFKIVDTQTDTTMGLVTGYLTPEGLYDARHSFSTPDANGSRNYIYEAENIAARNQYYRDNGIVRIKYNRLPEASVFYRFLKMRANAGNYTIIEDIESPLAPGHRDIITEPVL